MLRLVLCLCYGCSMVQAALAVLMCTTAHSVSPEQSGSLASIIYSSGLLIQLFNMTWYCLPFKYYLVLSIWTAVLYFENAVPSLCSGISNVQSQQAIVGLLTVSMDGIALCQDGTCFADCYYPCKKLYLWQMATFNVYFCYLTWRSERNSRKAFIDKLEDWPANDHIPRIGCGGVCSDYLSLFFYILYASWHILSLIY